MKILMLSPAWPLPVNTGGLVRIYNIFRELCRSHEVVLVSPGGVIHAGPGKDSTIESREKLRSNRSDVIRKVSAALSLWPFHACLYWDTWMKDKVAELLADTDFSLAYCHLIYTLPYLSRKSLPIILDQQNVDRQYWERKVKNARNSIERLFCLTNLYKTILFEKRYLSNITAIVSVSGLDSNNTKKYAQHIVSNFWVAPNGVELEKFVPEKRPMSHPCTSKLTIGFMGSLDLKLNQRAAQALIEEIFPALKKELPDIGLSLLIIGRNPPPDIVKHSMYTPEIMVTGTITDVQPYLAKVDILVLPLRGGGGTKLRVFEALAMQLPVIASPDAIQGIDELQDGTNFLAASTTSEFCAAIIRLIIDEQLRHKLALAGRNLVEEKYSWRIIMDNLVEELNSIAEVRAKQSDVSMNISSIEVVGGKAKSAD